MINSGQTSKTKDLRPKSRLALTPRKLLSLSILLLALWFISWQAAKLLIVSAPLQQADVIAVLAGSAVFKERSQTAADLYHAGAAAKIIITNDNQRGGWSVDEQRNIPYQELMARYLRRAGVPDEAIEPLSTPVTGTYEEAHLLRSYAEQKKLHSILVVTSAYHSRRALWTLNRVFASSGISVGLDAVPPGNQVPGPATWWLRLRGWQLVPGEYVKMIYYRLIY